MARLTTPPVPLPEAMFASGGELGRLIRAHDWSSTPLGAPETWPPSLQLVVGIVLSSSYPMAILWGPDLTLLYNDAFRAVLGPDQHPAALGCAVREGLPHLWEVVGPDVEQVVATAGEDAGGRQPMPVRPTNRFGDRYFDVSYGAVRDQEGAVGGVLLACSDVTGRVLTERRLAVQYTVSRALAESATLDEALASILPTIGRELGWDLSAYWAVDGSAGRLVWGSSWSSPAIDAARFVSTSREMAFTPGLGLPGRVWASGETVWIADLLADKNLPRGPAAAAAGLRSAFAFPIRCRDDVLGVVECFARATRQPDEDLLQAVAVLGRQIGEFVERRRAEDARSQLAAIVESSHDAILSKTLDGIITSWNPSAQRLYGYTPDEVLGRPVSILIPPDRPDEFPAIMERLKRGERIEHYETRRIDKYGRRLDVSVTISPIVGARGEIIGASAIARDISERKLADALVAGERRVLEMVAQGASLPDVLDTLTQTTEALAGDGLLASILLLDGDGTHLRHGAAPNLPDAYSRAIDGIAIGPRVGSCGTAAYRGSLVVVEDIAHDPLWADFRDLALEHGLGACWSTPILGSTGRVLGTFALYYREARAPKPEHLRLIDAVARTAALVVERKQIEQQLADRRRQAEELARDRADERDRLQQVIDGLPEAIVLGDTGGRFTMCNRATVDLLGIDLVGRPIPFDDEESVGARHPDGSPARGHELPLQRSIRAGELVRGEQWLFRRPGDGQEVALLMSSAPLHDREGAITGGVVVFQDITSLKSLEREKEDFLASAAHDLRNPLTSIRGYADLLRRHVERSASPDRERLMAGLAQILVSGQRMASLIDQMLDLTRLQLGRPLELHPTHTDLVALVREVAAASAQATEQHAIAVHSDCPELVGVWDAARLERAVQNLFSNAIKFSPDGGEVTVTVAREATPDGDVAVLAVRDRGMGIPADDLPGLFRRFYRAGNVVGKVAGTGLGLASVRQVIEEHGGTVAVESRLGEGSTFTLRLPLER